ncbi:biliverdin-producing heme oxygenase [Aureimonas glaciei]|uniref:Heme oxygenase n=1 Tax=Aureimonas glaciei TaxID=1776957 RepID=A0A917DG93_9HYPH|nr:biliverdin-producing heme oxygenase [Aureimonas glaciei]GGD33364.1 hypothetical protein GCM10011335_40470 [Aureimonas glaciei]
MTSAHLLLRQATADAHDVVDAAFGRFDLTRADDYRNFLSAQAEVLAPLEALLMKSPQLPPWRPRLALLARDLAALDADLPHPAPVDGLDGPGELLGALYVLEGSRLGGGMLVRGVGPGLPREFLGATHLKGEWRALLAELDAAAQTAPAEAAMLAGARRVFRLYAEAAERVATAAA